MSSGLQANTFHAYCFGLLNDAWHQVRAHRRNRRIRLSAATRRQPEAAILHRIRQPGKVPAMTCSLSLSVARTSCARPMTTPPTWRTSRWARCRCRESRSPRLTDQRRGCARPLPRDRPRLSAARGNVAAGRPRHFRPHHRPRRRPAQPPPVGPLEGAKASALHPD